MARMRCNHRKGFMARSTSKMMDKFLNQRVLARWAKAAKGAATAELSTLRTQRTNAKQLQAKLAELIHQADGRLALPRIGSNNFKRPEGTLWSWRPQLWRGPLGQKGIPAVQNKARLGDEITVYHDCEDSELTFRQLRNQKEGDIAPFALRLDVLGFDGNFLSIALDLPESACAGLKRVHIVQMNAVIDVETPIEIFARLNIKNGPNTTQEVKEISLDQNDVSVEFDLAYTDLNEKRIEKIWLDLIFEEPEMNQIVIRDLTFTRYPRAEL